MEKDFRKLSASFKSSIKTWEYFVNWQKVFKGVSEFEIILNKLNYLLGKSDLKKEFYGLVEKEPDVVKVFPILLALRYTDIEVYNIKEKTSKHFDFSVSGKHSPDEYYEFFTESGIDKIFREDGVKNLVDYVFGVEVGLDSNGRKNRGGTLMEDIVEQYINEFCNNKDFEYVAQANAKKIKNKWGYEVAVDKSSRSFDFAIYNPVNKKLKLVETNFFNGGGSKLKAVCGEFRGLNDVLKGQGIDFIWVTDGKGWESTLLPLEEVFNNNDYTFNLAMLEGGILEKMEW